MVDLESCLTDRGLVEYEFKQSVCKVYAAFITIILMLPHSLVYTKLFVDLCPASCAPSMNKVGLFGGLYIFSSQHQ